MMCKWVKTMQPDKEISRVFVKCISHFYIGFSKMPWMNMGADISSAFAESAAKATAIDATVFKKKVI